MDLQSQCWLFAENVQNSPANITAEQGGGGECQGASLELVMHRSGSGTGPPCLIT